MYNRTRLVEYDSNNTLKTTRKYKVLVNVQID